jgi:UrcA family protein
MKISNLIAPHALATCLLAAAAISEPALAADPQGVQPGLRMVHFADLDLESDAGRATLERRLARAVQSICAENPADTSVAVAEARQRCVAETTAALDGQVDVATRANRARATRTAGLQ